MVTISYSVFGICQILAFKWVAHTSMTTNLANAPSCFGLLSGASRFRAVLKPEAVKRCSTQRAAVHVLYRLQTHHFTEKLRRLCDVML